MTVLNKLGLPFERSDEHKGRRISRRIKNTSHTRVHMPKWRNPLSETWTKEHGSEYMKHKKILEHSRTAI
jgi:hypothetical protein